MWSVMTSALFGLSLLAAVALAALGGTLAGAACRAGGAAWPDALLTGGRATLAILTTLAAMVGAAAGVAAVLVAAGGL